MGSGSSAGFSAAISTASDKELKAVIADLSPEAKAKLAAATAAMGEGVETGKLTIRSGVAGDVIIVMDNMPKNMPVQELLQKLRAERPPPKASAYHLVLGDRRLPRRGTLLDCGVELDGEVLAVSALCSVSEELQARREEVLTAVAADSRGFPAAVALEEAMSMIRPSAKIMRVCTAVCRLFEIAPVDDGGDDPMSGFWQPSKNTFTADLEVCLAKLEGFKPELAEDVVGNAVAALARIEEYVVHPDFKPEEVGKSSLFFQTVCAWVLVQVDVLRELSGM
mmetsp:Transcript_47320/g.91306  ORF Transcript_47320/g.91306 Transcript_47320/m.91306 type:complete len:280 (-) Transcript_47320:42-881(-)